MTKKTQLRKIKNFRFNEDQPRDPDGKFGSGGGGSDKDDGSGGGGEDEDGGGGYDAVKSEAVDQINEQASEFTAIEDKYDGSAPDRDIARVSDLAKDAEYISEQINNSSKGFSDKVSDDISKTLGLLNDTMSDIEDPRILEDIKEPLDKIFAAVDDWESSRSYRKSIKTSIQKSWVSKTVDAKRTIAYSNLEVRAEGDGNTLIGYASVFDSPSEPMPFIEYVKRGAFSKTINDGADVRLLIDHEGVPLARTKSGTLVLEEDDRGLRVEADLDPSNPDAARIISAMKRGDLSQMSFAFRTIKDNWSDDRSVRELKEVQLFDVSVVTFPAYEETVAELRNASAPVTITPTSKLRLRKSQIAVAKLRSRQRAEQSFTRF